MAGRFIFLILFITSMLVYNYYTTEVLSTLIGNPVGTTIKTITQLSDSSLSVGLEKTTYTVAYLNVRMLPINLPFHLNTCSGLHSPVQQYVYWLTHVFTKRNSPTDLALVIFSRIDRTNINIYANVIIG